MIIPSKISIGTIWRDGGVMEFGIYLPQMSLASVVVPPFPSTFTVTPPED